jgi:hypothetical protein
MKIGPDKIDYPLPEDFYQPFRPVIEINEARGYHVAVLEMSAADLVAAREKPGQSDIVGRPQYVALTPRAMLVWPRPDREYELRVEYLPTPKVW